jgi:hypothetical protein
LPAYRRGITTLAGAAVVAWVTPIRTISWLADRERVLTTNSNARAPATNQTRPVLATEHEHSSTGRLTRRTAIASGLYASVSQVEHQTPEIDEDQASAGAQSALTALLPS